MSKVYVIASGKGGTGKSTSVVNLASALTNFKQNVVIADLNFTTPNLGLYFGAPIVPVTLNHVLQGKASVDEAIYEHETGVKIIPSSLSLKDTNKLNYKLLEEVIKKLKKNFTHIIFDSASGLGQEAKIALESSDEVIIVTNPNILSITDALKTIKLAEEMKKPVKGVIITRVRGDKNEMPKANVEEMLEVPILGIVPEDSAVEESLCKKNPVIKTRPRSRASRAYIDIAAKILGKQKKPESFVQKFIRAVFG